MTRDGGVKANVVFRRREQENGFLKVFWCIYMQFYLRRHRAHMLPGCSKNEIIYYMAMVTYDKKYKKTQKPKKHEEHKKIIIMQQQQKNNKNI